MNKVTGKLGEERLKVMMFADDLMVWGEKEEEVQEQLQEWIEEVKEIRKVEAMGMKFVRSPLVVTRNKSRNEVVQERLGVQGVHEIVEEARLR
uniref:(California timema) hypothetical protein n=1 Tax=Timema californicum TaxID=61474 RepID=A0A7R9JI06_TIMCA|nr:unnamed protein product [Timema californicum]